jgi:hypothetical protein
MKKLLLLTVLALTTIGAMAQDKTNHHNTSRSNKTTGGKVDPNTDTNESETDSIKTKNKSDFDFIPISVGEKPRPVGEKPRPVYSSCCRSCIPPRPYSEGATPITYTKLSKADAKIAIPAFKKYIGLKGDTDGSEARILERTECLKVGSTFYEFTDGTTICLTASVSAKSQNLPSERTGNDNNTNTVNRACRGILVTNSTGTAIYKKVTEVNGKSKK